jgi:hypothetical protein
MACPYIQKFPETEEAPIFDHTSIFALSTVVALTITAFLFSSSLTQHLPNRKTRIIFTWHLFSSLTHLTLESIYLYNVFFTSMSKLDIAYTRGIHSSPMTPPNVDFLGDSQNLYGSFYGISMGARLWHEYAKADKRYGGSDLGIISLELVSVFVLAPLGLYICSLLHRQESGRRVGFWMVIVAMGELYGNITSFIPELLSGSENFDTGNFLTFWIYLILLRGVWVFLPLWSLWYAYEDLTRHDLLATPKAMDGSLKLDASGKPAELAICRSGAVLGSMPIGTR